MRRLFLLLPLLILLFAYMGQAREMALTSDKDNGMTVQTSTNIARFSGNGVAQIFPVAFKFNNESDLVVLLVDEASGASAQLALNSQYTVSGDGDEQGGSVTVLTAPATGESVVVTRIVDILQLTDLRNQGKFYAEVHEDALDLLTMIAQQHQSAIDRTLRVSSADPLLEPIPPVATRARRLLSFDDAGNPIAVAPEPQSATALSLELASSSGSTLVGDGDGTVATSLRALEATDQSLTERTDDLENRIDRPGGDSSYHYFGGQLAELKKDLSDPLQQYVSITLVGDSITWGMTATGVAATTPRDGTLTDTRNNGSSPSWANLLHKHLGEEFYRDATAVESLSAGAQGGSNIFDYNKDVDLYPGLAPITPIGAWTSTTTSGPLLGQHFTVDTVAGAGTNTIEFTMTGTGFSLVYAALGDGGNYELFFNDVSQGVFSTNSTTLGVAVGYGYTREHSFGSHYTNMRVKIVALNGATSTKLVRLEAIRVTRSLQVINQGIIGTNFARYTNILIPDGAILDRSKYVIAQLGTNDRAETASSSGQAETPAALEIRANAFLDKVATLPGDKRVVLICANEATSNDKPTYKYTMTEVRAVLYKVAKSKKIDFIDQYAITRPLLLQGTTYTADGLHPDDFGHAMMFANIRDAIAHAHDSENDFAIVYPNGGTAAAPANVSIDSRYVVSNPFPNSQVVVEAEVQVAGVWGITGWYAGTTGVGVKASQSGDSIIVQTGSGHLLGAPGLTGGSFAGTTLSNTPLPCRVRVWKVKGVIK